jgi:hypothetical protein
MLLKIMTVHFDSLKVWEKADLLPVPPFLKQAIRYRFCNAGATPLFVFSGGITRMVSRSFSNTDFRL